MVKTRLESRTGGDTKNTSFAIAQKGLITGELVRYARLTTTFEQFNKIRELFIARLMQRGYKRKFIDRIVRQCNYFLLQEHYCKPIDFQARIAKYRAKQLIDYREPVPPVEGSTPLVTPTIVALFKACRNTLVLRCHLTQWMQSSDNNHKWTSTKRKSINRYVLPVIYNLLSPVEVWPMSSSVR